jgi:alanine-glyoxylate transaminase/serine-glyoxylate transaminase/serine-pyruvate transaminase
MIPGPIEISPAVQAAAEGPPDSHTAPWLIAAFGRALRAMRQLWRAAPGAQPFVLAGSGSLAMDAAVANLLDPGQRAVVVWSGYFSERMALMLERRGVEVELLRAEPGHLPEPEQVARALERPARALFLTHVDTSTGVLAEPTPYAELARGAGALFVVDGVCATAAEAFDMEALGADVYLTASQKAVGLPPGLALMVASPRALEARAALRNPPPLSLDWQSWKPIHEAYEVGQPSYFATPATPLIRALDVGTAELLAAEEAGQVGPAALWARHRRVAQAMRAAFSVLGLKLLPARPELAAHTLSALYLPAGVDAALPGRVAARGVLVAGGLLPSLRTRYFRVGHMGWITTQPEGLERTVRAVGEALKESGHSCDVEAAVAALRGGL